MQTYGEVISALALGGVMVYPLLVLGMVAVLVTLEKFFLFVRRARLPPGLIALAESDGFDWDDLAEEVARLDRHHYFRRFVTVLLDSRDRPLWWIESRAADEASLIEASLGGGLWLLETIVTAAPLLGLLGTIAGMIRSFKLFGDQGLVDPGGVTGGVAEALIATAIGLLIAMVSLFAFNYCTHRQARIMDEMERLGTLLIDHRRLALGAGEEGR